AAESDRGLPVRRRTADARDRPSADDPTVLPAARRAEPRPGAAARTADQGPDRRDQPAGDVRATGRAERRHGAVDRFARLRARDREDRYGQARRRAPRGRGHPRVLPGPRRRGGGVVPRRQALQAQEAVVIVTTPILEVSDLTLRFGGM